MSLTTNITTNSTDLGDIFIQVNSSANIMLTNSNTSKGDYMTYANDGWVSTGYSITITQPGYYLVSIQCTTPNSNDTKLSIYSFGLANNNYSTDVYIDPSNIVLATSPYTQGFNNIYNDVLFTQTMVFNNPTNTKYLVAWKTTGDNTYNIAFSIYAIYIGSNIVTTTQTIRM